MSIDTTPAKSADRRVVALDAYRGLVMFLMLAEVLRLALVARSFPDSPLWQFLGFHQSHVEWRGCSLHDLVQPSFAFLVGVVLPFSLAARAARGQRPRAMTAHAAWRALALVVLGIFLSSVDYPGVNFSFVDTLTQIGLGYFPLFLLARSAPRWQWAALATILVGYWAAFALYPRPGPDFDYLAVGVPADWPHQATGFAAHWNKNSNLAWAVSVWFLNLFPRARPWAFSEGGYAALNFVPTLGTMIMGLIAGRWLRAAGPCWRTVGRLTLAGLVCLTVGAALDQTGVCPSVKRIWTPAWAMYSGGWCLLMLAGFFATTDVAGFRVWAFPLRVVGANSITAYCLAHLTRPLLFSTLRTRPGRWTFGVFGEAYEPLAGGAAVLVVYWLILWWMYRRRIFLRI